MTDLIVGTLAIVGAVLVLVAGVGVLRFPDLYARMHAATKATTVAILPMPKMSSGITKVGMMIIDNSVRRSRNESFSSFR